MYSHIAPDITANVAAAKSAHISHALAIEYVLSSLSPMPNAMQNRAALAALWFLLFTPELDSVYPPNEITRHFAVGIEGITLKYIYRCHIILPVRSSFHPICEVDSLDDYIHRVHFGIMCSLAEPQFLECRFWRLDREFFVRLYLSPNLQHSSNFTVVAYTYVELGTRAGDRHAIDLQLPEPVDSQQPVARYTTYLTRRDMTVQQITPHAM